MEGVATPTWFSFPIMAALYAKDGRLDHRAAFPDAEGGLFDDAREGGFDGVVVVALGRRELLQGPLGFLGEGGVLGQVAALAVGRHGDRRPGPLVHPLQLVSARVAGDVNTRMVALGVKAHASVGEVVLQVADRDLVAGNDARGKDAGVPG